MSVRALHKFDFVFYSAMDSNICLQRDDLTSLAGKISIVAENELLLKPEEGLIYRQDRPFTGIALRHFTDGKVAIKKEYQHGKKHESGL